MTTPADHQDWLRRDGYLVPPGADLTDPERQLLSKFGHWMEALTSGQLGPVTADQERFLRVHHGEEAPSTPFELAWMKLRAIRSSQLKPVVGPLELTNLFARLEAARSAGLALQQKYTFRRLDILAKVQPELDAVDAEMTPEMKAMADQMLQAENAAREAVLAYGQSFHHGAVRASYSRGRVTFDNKSLQQYAEVHPEINQFKKVSQPIVSLRYNSGDFTLPGAAGNEPDTGNALPSADG
jgi:hypothetical protein